MELYLSLGKRFVIQVQVTAEVTTLRKLGDKINEHQLLVSHGEQTAVSYRGLPWLLNLMTMSAQHVDESLMCAYYDGRQTFYTFYTL